MLRGSRRRRSSQTVSYTDKKMSHATGMRRTLASGAITNASEENRITDEEHVRTAHVQQSPDESRISEQPTHRYPELCRKAANLRFCPRCLSTHLRDLVDLHAVGAKAVSKNAGAGLA